MHKEIQCLDWHSKFGLVEALRRNYYRSIAFGCASYLTFYELFQIFTDLLGIHFKFMAFYGLSWFDVRWTWMGKQIKLVELSSFAFHLTFLFGLEVAWLFLLLPKRQIWLEGMSTLVSLDISLIIDFKPTKFKSLKTCIHLANISLLCFYVFMFLCCSTVSFSAFVTREVSMMEEIKKKLKILYSWLEVMWGG